MRLTNAYATIILLVLAIGGPAWTADLAAPLFDDTTLHEVRLYIHPNDWRALKTNYLDNTYYPANLQWRGTMVENIGIRSRGLGSRSSDKPGLRVDFNRYEAATRFLGLKSVILDNLTQDPSMIRERVSMSLFRKMGMPAPRLAHARMYVNDQYAGLYTILESVDRDFLMRTFGEDTGYLYDYEWVDEYRFEYRGSDPGRYSPVPFKPETHETDPDARPVEAMIRTINQAPDEQFLAATSEYLDPAAILLYLAVEHYLGEIDGIAGNWGMNNFYLYRFAGGNRFQFIAWDKDVTFSVVDRSIWQNTDSNVLLRRLLAVPEARQAYLAALTLCAEEAGVEGGWLEQEIERAYRQVREAALADTSKPFSGAEFEAAIEHLRGFARQRAGFVRREVEDSGFETAAILREFRAVTAVR